MPDSREIGTPKKMPVHFYGKAKDGSPCLLIDATMEPFIQRILETPYVHIGPVLSGTVVPGMLFIKTLENPYGTHSTDNLNIEGMYFVNADTSLRKLIFSGQPS